ncbi:hypothetical protein Tco_0641071 [Tanacetum coccineum]
MQKKNLFKKVQRDKRLEKAQNQLKNQRIKKKKNCHRKDTAMHDNKDGIDIYMLVEKEYLLSRGVLRQMLVAKILVEQDNEMSRELLMKIFMQGLEVGLIRRIQGLDTAYWGFLRVGTTLDIFQNIIFIPYFQYGVLVFWIRRIDLVSFVVFGECRHGYAVSSLMDTAYWSSE